jgi:hypothetical protein
MEPRIRYALIILFLLLSIFAEARENQKPAWKGKIETENGIKVVKNPPQPLYGEFSFDLQEDLKIGGDPTAEAYYFPKGAAVRPDKKGNMFVADFGNKRVQMYDPVGQFVRTIGRQGQGPGEYQFPNQVLFDTEGDCIVYAATELVVFAPDGTFKKKINFRTFLNRLAIGPGGLIIGTTQPSPRDGWKQKIVQVDSQGTSVQSIAEYRGEFGESLKGFVLHWYTSDIAFSPLTSDAFVYGFSSTYRIHVADASGRTVFIIAMDEKPLSISGKEKEATRKDGYFAWYGKTDKPGEDAVFPDHRPYFSTMQNDDRGRLYVIRLKSILDKDGPQAIDVFSKDGIFLYRMSWPFVPSVIRNGALYYIRTDKDTGEYFVVRFKIKNWEAMKAI